MALYDYPRDKHPNITLTQFQRRAEDLEVGTLAMHWDGTYRDRNAFLENVFWAEEDYEGGQRPMPANDIAEHLTFSDTAPWNRFTDPAY